MTTRHALVTHLDVLVLLFLLLFLAALALLLGLLQPLDEGCSLGVDLFGQLLGDVLLGHLGPVTALIKRNITAAVLSPQLCINNLSVTTTAFAD